MDDRYEVFDTLGKGVFSTVLRARDTAHKNALGKHPEVAVKVGHQRPMQQVWQKWPAVRLKQLLYAPFCAEGVQTLPACHQSML